MAWETRRCRPRVLRKHLRGRGIGWRRHGPLPPKPGRPSGTGLIVACMTAVGLTTRSVRQFQAGRHTVERRAGGRKQSFSAQTARPTCCRWSYAFFGHVAGHRGPIGLRVAARTPAKIVETCTNVKWCFGRQLSAFSFWLSVSENDSRHLFFLVRTGSERRVVRREGQRYAQNEGCLDDANLFGQLLL